VLAIRTKQSIWDRFKSRPGNYFKAVSAETEIGVINSCFTQPSRNPMQTNFCTTPLFFCHGLVLQRVHSTESTNPCLIQLNGLRDSASITQLLLELRLQRF